MKILNKSEICANWSLARRLKVEFAACLRPLVDDIISGVKEECSIYNML